VNGPGPSSTLRELRAHLLAPRVLAVQAGVALVLGLSGPFGTYGTLGLAARMLYWAAVVFGTYAIGAALTLAVMGRLPLRRMRFASRVALRVGLGGALIGLVVMVYLTVLGLVFLGGPAQTLSVSLTSVTGAFAVSWVVLGLREMFLRDQPQDTPAASPPPILRRLPLDRRGVLISLSAEDHYVAIATTRGRDLVLMRLSDAIAEAGTVTGLQVHRSHWVALAQVRAARRQGDGAVLTLSDGREVPVSRARLADVRAAGLLAS